MDALKDSTIYPIGQLINMPEEERICALNKNLDREIAFSYDFYWDVPIGKRHKLHIEPKLDMGSIDHDVERIRQLISDSDPLNDPLSEHFRWLGDILIAIADEFGGCYENEDAE